MPSFKPKSVKKVKYNKKSAITLDTKHEEIVNQFFDDKLTMINYKKQIAKLSEDLEKHGDTLTVERQLEMQDEINDLKHAIRELKQKKKSYLLDNSKHIYEYFENKKNISMGTQSQITSSKTKALNSLFKIKEDIEQEEKHRPEHDNNTVIKYLSNVCDDFLDIKHFVYQTDICQVCHKGELIPVEEDGIMVCNICSRTVPYLIENDKPSYKEPPKEVCFYAYKRINHFKEILAQFQGKETTQIPPDVIENIKLQIKKERINISQITNDITKNILKKLGYNKYYEHIPFIKDKLGIKPPIMSPELEETLCNLFIELQAPYSKFCPDDRVNFLHYYYTAYKLCELLGEESYLPHFPMLKDPEKRMEQDVIWKKICQELDWEYIPTV